ncbi:hypothetical protein MAPG_06167 [Magnaporthiopsis poae ATCC 64411]|uniref:Uncharacterized protein n=1 Tax=Magnaporthiopsis poae (strain ATCC 64411 / 73-15) TaxID=644358 RepID=A0A0C4CSG0_MAGP6|nr:hypothetical protein, variant [Magnaporthiopsis poae ATCC 64411]KLU87164.1 hypothetical protein MAPG_06167 [Magnaporthiopsis poae ATCC 64411]
MEGRGPKKAHHHHQAADTCVSRPTLGVSPCCPTHLTSPQTAGTRENATFFTFGRPIAETLPIVVITSPSRPPTKEEEEKIEFRDPEWKEARSLSAAPQRERKRERGVPVVESGRRREARPFACSAIPRIHPIHAVHPILSFLVQPVPAWCVRLRPKCNAECEATHHTHTHANIHKSIGRHRLYLSSSLHAGRTGLRSSPPSPPATVRCPP